MLDQFGMLDHFLPQQGDQVEAGGAVGFAPPPWQGLISLAAFDAEGLQRGQQQGAVGGYHQDRLLGNSLEVPQLRLADTQGVLLVAVVDLDLPAVEINLQQGFGGAS